MNKKEYTIKLRDTFEEILLNQIDVINGEEKEKSDEEMLIALYLLFEGVLKNDELLEKLYLSNVTYQEVLEKISKES